MALPDTKLVRKTGRFPENGTLSAPAGVGSVFLFWQIMEEMRRKNFYNIMMFTL